jgi:DNA-binding transcriptional LysR family regulator
MTVQALDSDVMKAYVAAGLGVAIIPSYSFTAEQDHGLRVRDAAHLFSPGVSAVLLRRQSYLRDHVYRFLEHLDASLSRQRIEALIFEEK